MLRKRNWNLFCLRKVELGPVGLPEMLILAGGTSNMYPQSPIWWSEILLLELTFSWCSCTENWVFIARFDCREKKFKVHQSSLFTFSQFGLSRDTTCPLPPLGVVHCPHLVSQPCPVPPGSMDSRCILPPWCMPSEDATSLSHYVGTELLEGSFRIL